MKTESVSTSGLLLTAFVVLKLCKVIDWSWWWVLSPTWIPLAIVVAVMAIVVVAALIVSIYDGFKIPKRVADLPRDKDVIMVGDTKVHKRQVAEKKFGVRNSQTGYLD